MKLLLFIVRRILSLRYKVKLEGINNLKHDGPILLMPNHVALIDPRIILSFIGKYIKLSPVASEKYYSKPFLKQIMDFFGTVPIGEMADGADSNKVKEAFSNIVEALNDGKNILIYPSGQIYRQGFESIKGKQSVYKIVKQMPKNTKVIGIRDRGLWGSIWSKARDNGKTTFTGAYKKSIWYVICNFVFFVPKREVNIQIFDITKQINTYKNASLNEFNGYLESFYNKNIFDSKENNNEFFREKINYIPHYFYYNDVKNKKTPDIITGSLEELNIVNKNDISGISEEIKNKIKNKIAIIKDIEITSISDESKLILDLYFDSLDTAEIKSFVQANFSKASNPPITDLKTLADLYIMADGKSTNTEKLKDCIWNDESNLENSKLLINNISKIRDANILSLWKEVFKKNKNESFMWDNIFGMQTKKDFVIKAYLISNYIKQIGGEYIGIMLPSVGSSSLLIISTYLAGKTPVMFNWTLGKEAFNHCVKFSKVDKILSSNNFYDKVKNDFLEEHNKNNKFVFMEDLLKNISTKTKLKAFLKSFYMPIPKINNFDNAVILFTSGSESLPKAVPLTHINLIENIKGSLDLFSLKSNSKLLGFLPPFHSFGFTVNTIMPLITALKVVYTPDPNDAKTILNIILHTKISTITATPTFLKMIMSLANGDDLKTIENVVVGAEKCPEDTFEKFKELSPNGVILEGYGITECSPVVSINPIVGSKPGSVGKIINCLDCKIVPVEFSLQDKNIKICEEGEQGMIYISGASIFNGYLDKKIASPFEELNGKKYYKTGDLGFLDKDGFLHITGRLKRFIKIAGEMISLPFIEKILLEKYGGVDELKIAIEALEKDGEAKIVLFSLDELEIGEINSYLRSKGVSNLIKISENICVKEIPVLGTGKTDYKVLKKMINI